MTPDDDVRQAPEGAFFIEELRLHAKLERAACRLSDILMGNAASQRFGVNASTILANANNRGEALTDALDAMNRVLRDLDRLEKDYEKERQRG